MKTLLSKIMHLTWTPRSLARSCFFSVVVVFVCVCHSSARFFSSSSPSSYSLFDYTISFLFRATNQRFTYSLVISFWHADHCQTCWMPWPFAPHLGSMFTCWLPLLLYSYTHSQQLPCDSAMLLPNYSLISFFSSNRRVTSSTTIVAFAFVRRSRSLGRPRQTERSTSTFWTKKTGMI